MAEFTPKQRAYVAILRGCGVRPGEIVALTRKDIDLGRKMLYVHDA